MADSDDGNRALWRQNVVANLTASISLRLPAVLSSVLQSRQTAPDEAFRLQCQLSIADLADASAHKIASVPVASFDIGHGLAPSLGEVQTGSGRQKVSLSPASPGLFAEQHPCTEFTASSPRATLTGTLASKNPRKRNHSTLEARKKCTKPTSPQPKKSSRHTHLAQKSDSDEIILPINDDALDKLINGVWQALFSDFKVDPGDFFQNVRTIADSGDLELFGSSVVDETTTSSDGAVAARSLFSRVNLIARKVSQTSKFCRALEVSVQARWMHCFDDRVQVLSLTHSPEVAKKLAMGEACSDFGWSEKELRNKMCVWRGYQEIAQHGGYVTLIFAGPGLYRFCKYRLSFNDKSLKALLDLRPAFEVAADTLHPCWRHILGFLGLSQVRKYTGHLHDWVIRGPCGDPLPLATTYHKWDKHFSYQHIQESIIDKDVWGDHDPRSISQLTAPLSRSCEICREYQADNSAQNRCKCFPTIYGHSHAKLPPVQVAQTLSGKNNGLFACLPFAAGEALGEFVGEITSGITGLDVMFGQTETTSYQIWQGKSGNYTRFVNHSCKPNAHYEHFNWRGTQRIVLVSRGIKAGEEVTVDYSDIYWKVSRTITRQ